MYEIPDDFDPNTFVGCELELVSFSVNTVYLSFDRTGGLSITIEGETSHEYVDDHGVLLVRPETVPAAETRLVQLLGKTVVAATVESHVDLRLQFDDHQVLRCLGASKQYEMYHIAAGQRQIVV